jgi:hypothetical protein
MSGATGVVAHLIVGAREEPFLAALLASLAGAVDGLIVNDNSPEPSPHAAVFAESAFARAGTLVVDRTPWVDFSYARNRCLAVHVEVGAGPWIAFVDSDEVHGDRFARIAANVYRVPAGIDIIDGYTWHFFQSFDWYRSIERRMMLFRAGAAVRFSGRVHERLEGLSGARLALPYVYAHYGNVLPVRRQAEKGRQYSSLGAPGNVVAEDQLDAIDAGVFFRAYWAAALHFAGPHPPAADATIALLRERYRALFAETDRRIRAQQPPRTRLENAVMKLNYEQRWRLRAVNPLARMLVAP